MGNLIKGDNKCTLTVIKFLNISHKIIAGDREQEGVERGSRVKFSSGESIGKRRQGQTDSRNPSFRDLFASRV